MENELTLEIVRDRIINLVADSLDKTHDKFNQSFYDGMKGVISQIIDIRIEEDNKSDVNFDELNELFGNYEP